jgi:hypothetical protein
VRQLLDDQLLGRWVWWAGPVPWSPRSPNFNPLDLFFWGYVKEQVYIPPLLRTDNELKGRISETIASVNGDILRRIWQEFEYRLDVCRVTRGAKAKATPSHYTPWRRLGERRYSSYSFLTLALDEVSGQRHVSAALKPPSSPVPIGQEAGWAPESVWTQKLEENYCLFRGSNPDCPVHNQTLYWLCYPDSSY